MRVENPLPPFQLYRNNTFQCLRPSALLRAAGKNVEIHV
jgi:hypothetical protein